MQDKTRWRTFACYVQYTHGSLLFEQHNNLLAFFFRNIRLGLLRIPPNLIPLVATMAYMVWREIPLNVSTVIIFSISLGLAVNGTIHVLARFREEIRTGIGREAVLVRAAKGTGRAIVISCVTLMAGFAVFAVTAPMFADEWASFVLRGLAVALICKLVIDWFSGRSLGTAMAIFLNSWPLGIAFAVLLLPLTAEIGGLTSAWFLTASMALLALLLFAPIYNPPEGAEIGSARLRLTSLPWLPLLMISAVWGLYNAGISMIFGFGPLIMKEQGLAQEVARECCRSLRRK